MLSLFQRGWILLQIIPGPGNGNTVELVSLNGIETSSGTDYFFVEGYIVSEAEAATRFTFSVDLSPELPLTIDETSRSITNILTDTNYRPLFSIPVSNGTAFSHDFQNTIDHSLSQLHPGTSAAIVVRASGSGGNKTIPFAVNFRLV